MAYGAYQPHAMLAALWAEKGTDPDALNPYADRHRPRAEPIKREITMQQAIPLLKQFARQ